MRCVGVCLQLLWSLALCVASTPLGAWSLQQVDALPVAVASQLASTVDTRQPGRDLRRYYRLDANAGAGGQQQFLVLERDRGQRVWLYSADGAVVRELPLGEAPPPVSLGVRGAALPLDFPAQGARELFVVVDSVLGVHPRLRVESAERYNAHERDIWILEVGLTAALVMLLALSLAFSLLLREPGYLAYVGFLLLMLVAIALRHPLVFRMSSAMDLAPERVAAIGVLVSTLGALAAVTLLRAASGIGLRYPRGSRAMQWIALAGIVLGVIDVLTIQSHFRIAQLAFDGINLLFGANALLSAWLLSGTAWSGGRTARLFLLGWLPMVVVGAWFSVGSLIGLPQTPDPHRWVLIACMLQGVGWAIALGDRALSLQRDRDRAWALAELDELTGLPNRRMLDRSLGKARSGWLLLCDLDEFKSVNDRHGHAFGDHCLVHFAQCLRESLAGAAVFGRYGGEEFLAIVPDGDQAYAQTLAERLRERTASTPVDVRECRHRLTVSIGIAALDSADALAALALADRAMYRAKAAGRNRVEMA
jgi:diguanylate cyclase (GGDEF)-like protein